MKLADKATQHLKYTMTLAALQIRSRTPVVQPLDPMVLTIHGPGGSSHVRIGLPACSVLSRQPGSSASPFRDDGLARRLPIC